MPSKIFFMTQHENFGTWLTLQMKECGWSSRETARRAELSPTLITNIVSQGDSPSFDTCAALARAFNKPVTELLHLAGLVPADPGYDSETEELLHLFRQLDDVGRQDLLDLALAKLQRAKRGKSGETQAKPK
jgi:transcriptional regulator with XRE-family HTH domain